MDNLLTQIKNRRLQLNLRQKDMLLRAGITRQQYQRLESKGNPRLDTLELIAEGLECELMLISNEKLPLVKAILNNEADIPSSQQKMDDVINNPWKNLLGEDE
ncbi:helix-turn-helix transcriptional regulator [Pasteurella atlantica]|uniref:helix-turn-helix domain-containing protein n=1 Tax=Pasteurellaceae TaxID=712 RepID=UPI00277167F8|nr:helix-turn-helix transcriptional regulator [Pasteurella atlantica]MDP8034570.1 helix-turn-helix transcriptional regulator [Pasteurella atlantica]MDP8036483.1 helix-turn-helix transcriptional regulator [Pasteurella atlantica]MDP8038456.1 helix-turn-helix transcriptional regulator [Pasteurella atlantica]MDP8048787.1 helix-turn-helix transcriptional regulator [Pasteurella atlantica]MDP8050740.1 helix-turn-helix transcriptional regulator [Pasteurella atlantica]